MIANTCDSIFLDVTEDFVENYLKVEPFYIIYTRFEKIVNSKQSCEVTRRKYSVVESENKLHEIKQCEKIFHNFI